MPSPPTVPPTNIPPGTCAPCPTNPTNPATCSPGCRPIDPGQPTAGPGTQPSVPPPTKCFDLNPPTFGSVSGQCVNVFYGQSCVYTCDPGYGVVGASTLVCGSDGWSSSAPVCLPLLCPNQTVPQHGRLEGSCAPGFGGSSCTLICDLGYKLTGLNATQVNNTATITCRSDRTWSGELPLCTPITCPALPQRIPSGTIQSGSNCNPGIALKLCSYQCQPGYAITGSSSALLCQLNGMWSASVPGCTPILCPGIFSWPNGNLSGACAPGKAYDTCTVICNVGFLPRVQSLTCLENGMWDDTARPCQPIPCQRIRTHTSYDLLEGKGQITDVTNTSAIINYESTCNPAYATGTCWIQCKPGYLHPNGKNFYSVTCSERGIWQNPVVDCNPVICRPEKIPDNSIASDGCFTGQFAAQCVITCRKDYKLNPNPYGPFMSECLPTGQWSNPWKSLTCVRKLCLWTNVTVPIDHGMRTGDGCTTEARKGLSGECCVYSCERGFALRGRSHINCVDDQMQDDAQFDTFDLPLCVPVYCDANPTHPDPTITISTCTGNHFLAKCRVSCPSGTLLVASENEIVCGEDSTWKNLTTIRCVPPSITCPPFGPIDHGAWDEPGCQGYAGQDCTVKCQFGFVIRQNPTRKCRLNPDGFSASWDDATLPICLPVMCPGITAPANSDVSGQCAPGLPGTSCTITCNPGYKLYPFNIPGTVECDGDGNWNSEIPRCIRGTCPTLNPPPGGYISGYCTPGISGEMCKFSCPPGFFVNGRPNIICNDDGTWNGQVPLCLSPSGQQPNGQPGPGPGTPPPTPPGTSYSVPTRIPTRVPTVTTVRPGTCRARKICCPFLFVTVPFLTVNCRGQNNPAYLPEMGSSCTLRCTRGSLIDGSVRPQRRKVSLIHSVINSGQSDQKQELFTKKILYLICSRNSRWIGGDLNQIRCSNSPTVASPPIPAYPNKHPERPEVHFRPWFNIKTNETRLVVSDH